MIKSILDQNPFRYKEGTTARGKAWESVANSINKEGCKLLTSRSVRERYNVIKRKHLNKMRQQEKTSGIEYSLNEIDVLMQDVIDFEKSETDQLLEKAGKEKEKIEQQKEKAENVRKRALERLGETEEREGRQKVQKRHRGDMADMTMRYLKEKNEQMVQLRRDELEVKKAKLEMRKEEQKVQQQFFKQQQEQLVNLQQQVQQQQLEFQKSLMTMQQQQNDLLKLFLSKQ